MIAGANGEARPTGESVAPVGGSTSTHGTSEGRREAPGSLRSPGAKSSMRDGSPAASRDAPLSALDPAYLETAKRVNVASGKRSGGVAVADGRLMLWSPVVAHPGIGPRPGGDLQAQQMPAQGAQVARVVRSTLGLAPFAGRMA